MFDVHVPSSQINGVFFQILTEMNLNICCSCHAVIGLGTQTCFAVKGAGLSLYDYLIIIVNIKILSLNFFSKTTQCPVTTDCRYVSHKSADGSRINWRRVGTWDE